MSYLNNLKKSKRSLAEQVKDGEKGGHENDKRMLNYYDLKVGESMKVLLVPDVNGELFLRFSKHGPNLKYTDHEGKTQRVRGVGSIGVMPDSSKSPIMQHGYSFLEKEKETGIKAFRETAKKFFPTNYTYVSCVVLDSPIEITASADGNECKLFSLPYAVEKMIGNVITSGEMEEDDLWYTPLIIKKSKNDGGFATYEDSMFSRKRMSEEMEEYVSELNVVQYDFSEIDIIPETPTAEAQQEWLDKAIAGLAKHEKGAHVDEDDGDTPAPRKSRLAKDDDSDDDVPVRKSRPVEPEDDAPVQSKRKPAPAPADDELPEDFGAPEEDDVPVRKSRPVETEPESEDDTPKQSMKDRMARLRGRA